MKQRIILLAGAIFAFGLLLALLLPSLISALPGQVRGLLPDEVLRAITTPLPTALPAPIAAVEATPIPLQQLLLANGVAAATATATPTAVPPTNTPPATSPPIEATEYCPVPENDCSTPVDRILPAATATATPPPTATPTPSLTPTPSPAPLPQKVAITGLTVVPQKFNNCGSANMSVMLNYYGQPHTQIDISNTIKPHYDDRNVTPEELVAYANEQTDLRAAVFRGGDIDLLRTLIQAGFPVIVEKGYEPDEWQGWMGHYLTLIGYDDGAQQFTSLDTYLGPWDSSGRPISYDELAFRWAQFNHTFLLVYRSFEEEEVAGLLGPAFTEHTAMWKNAATGAETTLAAQPDDAFAWFNLGASLTELGKLTDDNALYTAAAAAFDQSRLVGLPPRMLWYQFQIYTAYIRSGRIDEALALASAVMQSDGGWHVEESHFYQGLAYEAAGNPDLAHSAYKRALDIKPRYTEAAQALNNLAVQ
jgi:tetratricopeptide (TPR) repeat protein